jgi:putative alpha-1,2-mannosidase
LTFSSTWFDNTSGKVRGLARWELLGIDTNTMIGEPGINIIAEAYLKGITGFDISTAYRLCREVVIREWRHCRKHRSRPGCCCHLRQRPGLSFCSGNGNSGS